MVRHAKCAISAILSIRREHIIAIRAWCLGGSVSLPMKYFVTYSGPDHQHRNYCYTVRERTLLALMNELTDAPEWQRTIFDSAFTFKWKSAKLMSERDIIKSMTDWCVEKVKYYVPEYVQSKLVPTIDEGVIKSDIVISKSLHHEFQKATASLRRVSRQTSHADEVSDVVNPFLYPFNWEHTRTLHFETPLNLSDCIRRSDEGQLTRQSTEDDCPVEERSRYRNDMAFSRRFQYLSFEITFGDRGEGGFRIISYINNVHSIKHRAFYNTLETFIDKIISIFNRIIMALKAPSYENVRLHVADLGREPMIKKDVDDFCSPEQRAISDFVDAQGRYRDWLFVDLKKEFWNIGLQFVLHIQEINLTPNRPHFKGEEWHVQGQRNERTCATATYVYSSDNTTSASLSFRRRVHVEEASLAKDYIQEPPFAPEIYDAESGDPVIQYMSEIELREGRVLTYPNIFQTRLLPFELKDPSKPGHVKLLTMHLIDSNRRMMSTTMVPPQRRDWWADEIRRQNARIYRLPTEVWERIVDMVEGYSICMDEAERIRREFMKERAEFQKKHTKAMEEYLE